jgi:hypothetical protein
MVFISVYNWKHTNTYVHSGVRGFTKRPGAKSGFTYMTTDAAILVALNSSWMEERLWNLEHLVFDFSGTTWQIRRTPLHKQYSDAALQNRFCRKIISGKQFMVGCLHPSIMDILGPIILCCKVFSSIPGLYLQDDRNTPAMTTKCISKHRTRYLGGEDCPRTPGLLAILCGNHGI